VVTVRTLGGVTVGEHWPLCSQLVQHGSEGDDGLVDLRPMSMKFPHGVQRPYSTWPLGNSRCSDSCEHIGRSWINCSSLDGLTVS